MTIDAIGPSDDTLEIYECVITISEPEITAQQEPTHPTGVSSQDQLDKLQAETTLARAHHVNPHLQAVNLNNPLEIYDYVDNWINELSFVGYSVKDPAKELDDIKELLPYVHSCRSTERAVLGLIMEAEMCLIHPSYEEIEKTYLPLYQAIEEDQKYVSHICWALRMNPFTSEEKLHYLEHLRTLRNEETAFTLIKTEWDADPSCYKMIKEMYFPIIFNLDADEESINSLEWFIQLIPDQLVNKPISMDEKITILEDLKQITSQYGDAALGVLILYLLPLEMTLDSSRYFEVKNQYFSAFPKDIFSSDLIEIFLELFVYKINLMPLDYEMQIAILNDLKTIADDFDSHSIAIQELRSYISDTRHYVELLHKSF